MIGTRSFLLELAPLVFVLVMFTAGIVVAIRDRKVSGLVLSGCVSVIGILMGVRFFQQMSGHRFLADLKPEQVASIGVAGTEITDAKHIASIVKALNARQWFSSNHGGWAQPVELILTLRNGDVRRYRIAHYLREHGTVIMFRRNSGGIRWADGYAFAHTLPDALAAADVKLPEQP